MVSGLNLGTGIQAELLLNLCLQQHCPIEMGCKTTQNNLKYSSSTFKKYKDTGKINFNNMLNLTCYIQNISTCDQYKNY